MQLPRSFALVPGLVIMPEVASTNDELARLASEDAAPDFTVVVTDSQTAGRGRLGRDWVAPPGAALAISVLLRPTLAAGRPLGVDNYGWLPLIAGAAMTRAVRGVLPADRVGLKWPNDVLVGGAKVCGILAELQPAGGVVIGAGINLGMSREQLPTPTSTSLSIEGASASGDALADLVLSTYLTQLRELTSAFLVAGGDAGASGVLALVTGLCSTLGRDVRVQLPGGSDLFGIATGIDATGRLVVTSNGAPTSVAAGDVTHLRYE